MAQIRIDLPAAKEVGSSLFVRVFSTLAYCPCSSWPRLLLQRSMVYDYSPDRTGLLHGLWSVERVFHASQRN